MKIIMRSDRSHREANGQVAQHDQTTKMTDPQHRDDPVLAEIVRRLVAVYQPERVYLFGSHARGDTGPDSDYDILVVVPDDASLERRGGRLGYQALRGTATATDVVVMTRGYFDWMLGAAASLPATVVREGRTLYAA